uniref:EF-hand calcium binding domain 13 n=1 Tax=Loxodonta africana TaxID=9785 RepID=G3TZX9_LOXAF
NLCFIYPLALPDVIENLNNLSKENMNVSDLWNILSGLNNNLKKGEFLAALKLAPVDESDKVQFKEFAEVAKNIHDASRLDELKEADFALNLLEGDMVAGKNLEDFLRNIGIKSPKEEVEKILQSDFVSENNMVNIKDCMRALRDTQKFSNFMALNEAISTLDCMEESYQSGKDKHSDALENTDRPIFTDKALQEILYDSYVEDFRKEVVSSNLKFPDENEIKKTAYILSHVDNGRISIPNLEHALKNLNMNLTEEDFSEALKHCDISENTEVDLKEFLMGLKEIPCFRKSIATQLLLATSQILQNGLIDVSDLKTSLMNDELYGANAILDEVLRHEPEYENGKMTIQEFMTKVSNTLTVPNDADKNQFYNFDINKIEDTAVSELQQRLNAIGIDLAEDKIEMALENTNPNSECVNFKDIIRELTNTDEFIECQRIEDAWKVVDTVSDGKVEIRDLLSTLKTVEKPLNKEQCKVLPNSAADGEHFFKNVNSVFREVAMELTNRNRIDTNLLGCNGQNKKHGTALLFLMSKYFIKTAQYMNFKPLLNKLNCEVGKKKKIQQSTFMKTDVQLTIRRLYVLLSFRNYKQFLGSYNLVTYNCPVPTLVFTDLFQGIATVEKIRNEKMPVNELSSRLLSIGSLLNSKTFQEILRQASIDENSEVSLRQILETLNASKPVPVFEDIHTALNTVNLMNCDRIQVNDLKDAFDDLGIPLKSEEHKMLEKTLDVDAGFRNKVPAIIFIF